MLDPTIFFQKNTTSQMDIDVNDDDGEDSTIKSIIDGDDEEEDNDKITLLIFSALLHTPTLRPSFYVRNRIEWKRHVKELLSEGPNMFLCTYKMNHPSL